MSQSFRGRAIAGLISVALASTVLAGADHDHAVNAGAAAPAQGPLRFEAHGDLFELVGVAGNGILTLWLDRYQSNEPVTQARVDIEIRAQTAAPLKVSATPAAEGTYTLAADLLKQPGNYALAIGVREETESEVLSATLSIPDSHQNAEHAWETLGSRGWIAAGAMLSLAATLVILIRRRKPGGGAR
jgi:hypothetical protein